MSMEVDSKHPMYVEQLPDWVICRDSYKGERAVKEKGTKYLPATSSMISGGMATDKDIGSLMYKAYKTRAVYHEFMSEAVETFIGMMWSKPPSIELPAALEDLRTNATTDGEGLEELLRRINEQQLVAGRLGLLLDLPNEPTVSTILPYIALYKAEHIINWDDGARQEVDEKKLNLVVLDESQYERDDHFKWEMREKYRVLSLGELGPNEQIGTYSYGLFGQVKGSNSTTKEFNQEDLGEPALRGKKLEQIPFVFINTKDVATNPDDPPLVGLARLCLAIYRGEADYRQSLFLQGQDTLVIIGARNSGDDRETGTGAILELPAGGDAKYIGVDSKGLEEQRQALENDKAAASSKAGKLIDMRSKSKESGEALKTRIAAETANLNQIARSGAKALEMILKIAAEWVGANPDEVSVKPNLDFVNRQMTGKELSELMDSKRKGAPISNQTIHKIMASTEMTELTFEEEQALINEEEPDLEGTGVEDDEE